MHVAPLETDDYILTAMELPDGTGKILVVGDDISFEMACATYTAAKDQIIRTANFLDDGQHDAIAKAEWFVYEHLEELLDQFGDPDVVTLSDFETEADLFFLKPEDKDQITLLYHRIINHECKWRIEEDGLNVQFRMVSLKAYMDWLVEKQLDNTNVNRARFIAGHA